MKGSLTNTCDLHLDCTGPPCMCNATSCFADMLEAGEGRGEEGKERKEMKKNKNKPISIQFSFREKEVCTPSLMVVKALQMYGCCIWGFIGLSPPVCTAYMLLGGARE